MTKETRSKVFALYTILFVGWFLLAHSSSYAEVKILHRKLSSPTDHYMHGLLKLAGEHSSHDFHIVEKREKITRSMLERLIESGDLNVMWSGASKEMDQRFLPVYIPAFKGMMGYRIFIIRDGDQSRFDRIQNLAGLKSVTFGQGTTWSDTTILRANGLDVVTSIKTAGLYYMLDGGRFDAFPRGMHEPWNEVANYPRLPLAVENKILLKYDMPYLFYVSKKYPQVVEQVRLGLEGAIADGSFERYFLNNSGIKKVFKREDVSKRERIHIQNNNLSNSIPMDRKELWLDLDKLAAEYALEVSSNTIAQASN